MWGKATQDPPQKSDQEMVNLSDNESENSGLADEEYESRAKCLCHTIIRCFELWKLIQKVERHETEDMKRLFEMETAEEIREFQKEKNKEICDDQNLKKRMNQMYEHWTKLKQFKNLQEYRNYSYVESEKAETNGEQTKLTVDQPEQPKVTEEEREILDELLTYKTDSESYAQFCVSLGKCEVYEEKTSLRRKLFRSMLAERVMKKMVRKFEIALKLDYDDKFTDYKEMFNALQNLKEELSETKVSLDNKFFSGKKCKALPTYHAKFLFVVKDAIKKAKQKYLRDGLDHSKEDQLKILQRLVPVQHEQTTPLALLCEFGTIEMFEALLVSTEVVDVWSMILGNTPQIWTTGIDKRNNKVEGTGPCLVHYAAMNPSDEILRYLVDNKLVDGLEIKQSGKEKTPLHFAAQYRSIKCVDFLREKGCSHLVETSLGETPLHLAASGGDLDTFNHVYRMYPEEELCLRYEAKYGPPLLYAARNNNAECVGAILDMQTEADATAHDEDCDTALHYISKEANTRWLAKLLKANALLGEKNEVGNAPIDWISYKRLKQLLDKHTTLVKLERLKGDTSRKDHTEVIFTNLFGHHASGSDMENIMAIAQAANAEAPGEEEPKNLCLHPLCQAIVSIKWQKVRKFFFLKLAFFLPFVFFLSLHPILQMQRDLRINSDNNDTSSMSSEQYTHWIKFSLLGTQIFLIIQVLSGLLSLFVLTKPFLERSATYVNVHKFNTRRVRRLLEFYWEELLWSDWYEYVLWVIAFMHLSDAISPIVVVIASWFSLFYVCSNHPSILPLRYMLVRILLRYIKFLIFSLGLIGGFALGFFLLVNKCKLDSNHEGVCAEGFDTLYLTMLKVPSMMMGEISFESFKFKASAHLQFLFGSFIFLVTCCLFNMMNGLAINITTELEKKAHVFSTIAQCEMIIEFEALLKQMSSWLEYLHLPGKNAINSVWVERIKVQPSTGECKNLEPYDKREHLNAPEEDLWETNDHRRAEWVWMNRGFTLDSAIVRAGLECSERNVYKDPADIEFSLDFAREDEEGDDGINEEADTLIPLVTKPSVQAPFDALGSDEPK